MGLKNRIANWILKGAEIDYEKEWLKTLKLADDLSKLYDQQKERYEKLISMYEDKQNDLEAHTNKMADASLNVLEQLKKTNEDFNELGNLYNKMVTKGNEVIDAYEELTKKYNIVVKKNNAAVETLKNIAGAYGISDKYHENAWHAGWLTITEALYDAINRDDAYVVEDFWDTSSQGTVVFYDSHRSGWFYINQKSLYRIVSTFLTMKGYPQIVVGSNKEILHTLQNFKVLTERVPINMPFGVEVKMSDQIIPEKPDDGYDCTSPYHKGEKYIRLDIEYLKNLIDKYSTELKGA